MSPQNARKAADALAKLRVLFVRHRRRPGLTFVKRFFDLKDLGPLKAAKLGRKFLHRRRNDGEGGDEVGVAVTLNDLRADRRRLEAKLGAGELFDRRRNVR